MPHHGRKDNADWLPLGGNIFELVTRRLDHTVIKANEIPAAWKWEARSNISVIKVLLKYMARHVLMQRDRDDLMTRHAPALPLMTEDLEPARTRPSVFCTFIIYFKAWKVKPFTANDLWCQQEEDKSMPLESIGFQARSQSNWMFDESFLAIWLLWK